jgi:phenylacetic acid degradation operon negative regulatory protein
MDMLPVVSKNVTAQEPERTPSRGKSVRWVPFLFGATGRDELPGPVLVRLLTDFGMTAAAARGLLDRLRRQGDLVSTRRGRRVGYRLDGELAAGFRIVRAGARPTPEWPGYFHTLIYHVPEQGRSYRDQLRRLALLSGFGQLTPGVLISLTDHWARLEGRLPPAPPLARIFPARLHLSEPDAAIAASQAWDLPGLDRLYRHHLATLDAALDPRNASDRPTGAAALRHFEQLIGPVLVDSIRAPSLPPALQPKDWVLPRLWTVLAQVQREYLPSVAAHLREVLGGEPG